MISVVTRSVEETQKLAASLARSIANRSQRREPIVIALNGELGAGKTTFVGGFLHELGVTGAIRSPTYTLIEPYDLSFGTVYHLDLYRLADPRELEMLALRDLLQPGAVLIVEWAEKGRKELPVADLTLNLRYADQAAQSGIRRIHFESGSTTGKELALSVQGSLDEAGVSS